MLITRKMYLNPKYLNGDIHKFLLDELKERMKKECTIEHGYILSIDRIIRVIDGFNISPINCDIICEVEFEAKILKPKVNDEYEGKVCVILPKAGVLMDVQNCLKILVKSDSLNNYTYDSTSNSYTHIRQKEKHIVIGDVIHVQLRGVKYTEHKFCCFGDFVEI